MNELRTRIIAALLSEDDVVLMADAVIAELGLERQEIRVQPGEPTQAHRYTTEWSLDA
jgi:hypothetical protein